MMTKFFPSIELGCWFLQKQERGQWGWRGGRDFPQPSRPVLDPPSPLYNEYRVIPGGRPAGAWLWPLTPCSAQVKERVELYLYSPYGPPWSFVGRPLPLHTYGERKNIDKNTA